LQLPAQFGEGGPGFVIEQGGDGRHQAAAVLVTVQVPRRGGITIHFQRLMVSLPLGWY
jgi:hypothetical protein